MELVKVKNKYQIVIPEEVRRRANIEIGDYLEAKVIKDGVSFTPKSLLDRELAEALEEVRQGKTIGPFNSVAEAMKDFKMRHKQRK